MNRTVVVRLLEKCGHAVALAGAGREVLAALDRQDFDVVLMDVHMPEMDGLEAAREIRRREAGSGRHLRIVALTAAAMEGDRELCLAAGMDGYVAKPIGAEELFKAVEAPLAMA